MSDSFAAFAAQHFNLYCLRTSKHLLLASSINHQPTPLQQPLLYLSPTKFAISLQANRVILHYMQSGGDDADTDADAALVHGLVYNAVVASVATEVRDEVFCQLVKQTRGCPSRLQLKRGLQLVHACLAASAPSPLLASAVAAHLKQLAAAYPSSSATVGHAAAQCSDALAAIQRLGPRHILSRLEVRRALHVAAPSLPSAWGLALSVHAAGPGREETVCVPMHSWVTAGEAKAIACAAAGINDAGDADCIFLHAVTERGAEALLANGGGLMRQLEQLLGAGESESDDGESGLHGRRQWRPPPDSNGLDTVLLLPRQEEEAYGCRRGDFYCLSSPSVESIGDHPPPPRPLKGLSLARRCVNALKAARAALRHGPVRAREPMAPEVVPALPTPLSPLAPQSPPAPPAASVKALRVELRVAVFPFGGPPPPCLSMPSRPSSAMPSPRRPSMPTRKRWPAHDATCELLLWQLVPALARGELTCCGGSDEHLRLAALVCAFEWKRNAAGGLNGDGEGKEEDNADLRLAFFRRVESDAAAVCDEEKGEAAPAPTDEGRAAFVAARLDGLLPRRLLETGAGGLHYRGRLDPDSPSLTAPRSPEPYPKPAPALAPTPAPAAFLAPPLVTLPMPLTLPHIPGLDLDLSPCTGAGPSADVDSPPVALEDPGAFRSFLSASVARLWRHVDSQSAAACRDDFLEGARCALGYGAVSARPSAVEVRSKVSGGGLTLGDREATGNRIDSAASEGGLTRALPLPPSQPLSVPLPPPTMDSAFADMEFKVSCHGITVTAVPPAAKGAAAGVRASVFGAAAVEVLLLHLDWDDITAWGHSERELGLRYRRRGEGDVHADNSGGDSGDCDSITFTLPDHDAPVLAEIVARYMAHCDLVGAL